MILLRKSSTKNAKSTKRNNAWILKEPVIEEEPEQKFQERYLSCQKASLEETAAVQGKESPNPHAKLIYVNQYRDEYYDVENLALQFYSLHKNMNGMHCENAFGKTMFGLLFWETIFDDRIPYAW